MSLGSKIRELRIAQGLTQSDLGSGLVTPSMISQIESDKANPSYKVLEAIAVKLETPLEHFLVDVQSQLEHATAYKIGRALLLAGKVEPAAIAFQQLLDSPLHPPVLKIQDVKFSLAECFIEMENLSSATELLDSVLDLPDAHILLRANKLRGDVEYKKKKFSKAVVFYEKALETFSLLPWPDPTLQAGVLQQLGRIYEGFGEIAESVTYFELACKYLKGGHDPSQIAYVYLELGSSYMTIGEYERASEYAQIAESIFLSMSFTHMATEAKYQLGKIKALAGAPDQAIQILNECLQQLTQVTDAIQEVIILGEIARVHLLKKDYDLSKSIATSALSILAENHVAAASILKTLALDEMELGNIVRAIELLEKAKAICLHEGLVREAAENASLLANLYHDQGNLALANLNLKDALHVVKEDLNERGIIL